MWSKLNIKITKKMALILTLVSIGDSYENVQNIINKNLKNSESENLYKRSDQKIISVIYTLNRWFKPRYVCTVVFDERVVIDKFTKFLD